MKESSAVIKLTKSEIEMIINSLQFTEEAAEFFDADNIFTNKIKNDFINIRKDISKGEKEIEARNETKEEDRNGPQACKSCDD